MRKPIATFIAAATLAAGATPLAAQDGASAHQDHDAGAQIQAVAAAALPMEDVLAASLRDEDRARDEWRHPAETLAFFRVAPGQTVVDYMPAGGWYTRVLVPYLGAEGHYIGLTPDPAAADAERFEGYFAGLPGKFREAVPGWGLSGAPIAIYGSQDLPEGMKGQVDRVLIFREMHNLLRSGVMYTELTRIRDLLKPDGMVGIVQHRAKAETPGDYTLGQNGYLRQEDVVALMRAHGFRLVDSSEINANSRDTADHPKGVWELPPSLGTGREELKSVGESDRMTLLFAKA